MAVRVLIVEDKPIFADTLRLFLDRDERIEIVGVASNGADAIDLASREHADVVLMDIAMPTMDGIEATRRLLEIDPDARVLVLSGVDPDGVREEVRRAGAVGLILKGSVTHELIDEILAAAAPSSGPH